MVFAVGLAVAWLFLRLMTSNLLGRNKKAEDLGTALRSLVQLMDNGGELRVKPPTGSLRLVRRSGDEKGVQVEMTVRGPTTTLHRIADHLRTSGCRRVELTDEALLAELRIEDIWNQHCIDQAATPARLAVRALSSEANCALNLSLHGPRSRRIVRRRKSMAGSR